jgi:trigger factor
MNVKIENVSSVKKKLSFEVAAEQVDTAIDKAYQKIGKTAKIKGFRPGKIPRSILEQYYAPQMEEQVLSRLINDSYFKALVDHQIPAISDPEIVDSSPLEKGKPFTYQAQVEIKPEIEVKDYQGLSLQKEKLDIDEEVISGRLEEMRASRAEMVVSSREEAVLGDFVSIDFEGFVDEVPFEGGSAQDHVLELGSGSFIPGFEDQVVGMSRGEERQVTVTFPEEYGNADLAGKPATFKVVLKEIKEKVLPALDDEFAKGFGLGSLTELQERLQENYRTQEINRIEGDLRERLVTVLIERNPMEVPDTMVEKQLDHMLENVRNRFKSQGMNMEMLGLTDESFRQMYRETAVRQVQGALLLEAVARQEKIEVASAELDGKLEKIAEMANAPLEAVKSYYARDEARRGLMAQAVEEKAVQFLLDGSNIEEVAKEQLADRETSNEKE